MKRITAVSVGRSDWGIYRPVLQAIQATPEFDLTLIAAGAHLAPQFGNTIEEIRQEGFEVAESVDMLLAADTPVAVAKSMGLGMIGFGQCYQRLQPDLLLVLGDRFEMHAAAAAAVPFALPIAHLHGGEVTSGAIDDSLRHAITKFSHLHFVATEDYRRRVIQLGEEPWRVTVSGAPSLDNLQSVQWAERYELEELIGMPLQPAPILATYHPVTRQLGRTAWQIEQFLQAVSELQRPIVLTKPNADPGGQLIIKKIEEFCQTHPRARLVDNLGHRAYFSLMRISAGVVGNSSSGIIEAASLGIPVVNIGSRQEGRARSENVIDVGDSQAEIRQGIRECLEASFRWQLVGLRNVYGDGQAATRILHKLKSTPLDERLLLKRFHDSVSETLPESKACGKKAGPLRCWPPGLGLDDTGPNGQLRTVSGEECHSSQ